ncbi:MED6-domain-containing protein [Gloeophyllum trabeum ATCC 11539]|uniref:Mediator of RNA polymerase II transcription subunit 6 n=1 Tax=Gloeophyllum trabeum (strain ATCC 11539 / FP-39264 / Madison 617) TaxID=670483 RepID=S7QNB6_GLOTA|nr:MED6-domain-containing protein [Gloeophyllum trabeum ATCC 11539]EPQ60988.1 MED6-domain-containing protein [Gloeophyllum trabeum ATCC 11539]
MDMTDLHPPDDYSHRFFIWHEWIQANGPLTAENVFDYFATSMFYDKQSNNQVLRMQTMHTGQPLLNEAEELKRFTGIEFAVVHAQPPSLFIIHKRERLSPEYVRPLAAYFIMNNRIYQSPDVYTVLSNRLLATVNALQSSLDTLRKHRPDYTPRTGFIWPIVDPSVSEDASGKRGGEEDPLAPDENANELAAGQGTPSASVKRRAANKLQNNMLMYNAMRTTAAHTAAREQAPPPITESASVPETPVTRSSATPAPVADREPQGRTLASVPAPQEVASVKGVPGAGKKKKKRMWKSYILVFVCRHSMATSYEGTSLAASAAT